MYLDFLEHGSPLSVKIASIAVSLVLFAVVAVPVLAVAARIVA